MKMRKNIVLLVAGVFLVTIGYHFGSESADFESREVVFQEAGRGQYEIESAALVSEESDAQSLYSFNEAFTSVAESVTPSVVTITAEKVVKMPEYPGFDDNFWKFFFGFPFPQGESRTTALGSGVIVTEDGYILTNNHVVERGEKIIVRLIDKREYNAEIVGTDPVTDLALIKIDAKDLTPATLGDSETIRVGEWVLAIGSPLSENLAHTVTAGIVSAKGRSNIIGGENRYEYFIQTDAAINPGNSGGALVNIRGELIGINTAIATAGGSGNIGIGFAIPIDLAKKVMKDLVEKGRVVRAWLGVYIQDVDDDKAKALKLDTREGAIVSEVVEDSPADKAGIEIGDVIIEFDGKKVESSSHLQTLVGNSEVGEKKKVKVIRNGKEKILEVKLSERPESEEIAAAGGAKSSEKLGIYVRELTPQLAEEYGYDSEEKGVIITRIESGTEAAKVLRPGDIIKRIGDKDIDSIEDYKKAIEEVEGEVVLILIKRGERNFFVTLEIPE